jgi:hypothetical protein
MLVHIIHGATVADGSAGLVSEVEGRRGSALIDQPRGWAHAVGMS